MLAEINYIIMPDINFVYKKYKSFAEKLLSGQAFEAERYGVEKMPIYFISTYLDKYSNNQTHGIFDEKGNNLGRVHFGKRELCITQIQDGFHLNGYIPFKHITFI